MKVLKLTHVENKEGTGAYCIYDANNCPDLFEELALVMQFGEVGEEWKITIEEMPEEEFKALPEFTGW